MTNEITNNNVVSLKLIGRNSFKIRKKKHSEVNEMDAKNNWKAWLYLAPVLILMAVFLVYPLVDTFIISFYKDYNYIKGTNNGLTFDNYLYVLGLLEIEGARETRVIEYAIPNTLFLTFVTVPLSITIALLISVLLNSLKWFQKILQTIFFLPYVTNTIAVGMVFAVIFDKNGLFNYVFGIEKSWIANATRWDAMLPLCLRLYLNFNSCRKLDAHKSLYSLLLGVENIDKSLVRAHFELLTAILVLVHRSKDRYDLLVGRKRNRTADSASVSLCYVNYLLCSRVDYSRVIALESYSDFSLCHFVVLLFTYCSTVLRRARGFTLCRAFQSRTNKISSDSLARTTGTDKEHSCPKA